VVEELLLLGALDGKVVIGSMNRGGLYGASWTMDDRFTGYDAAAIAAAGFEGGKMLTRIDPDDPTTVATLESCGHRFHGSYQCCGFPITFCTKTITLIHQSLHRNSW